MSLPHDSWHRTQSRQGFAGNKINVTVAVSFSRYARGYSICMNLCVYNDNSQTVTVQGTDCVTLLCYATPSSYVPLSVNLDSTFEQATNTSSHGLSYPEFINRIQVRDIRNTKSKVQDTCGVQ
jgi:hypothetical protein